MNLARVFLVILFLFVFPTSQLMCDILLGLNSGIEIDGTGNISPLIGVSGKIDYYKFFNEEWSFFADGGGFADYNFLLSDFSYMLDLYADFSYRKDNFFTKAQIGAEGKGSSLTAGDIITLSPSLYFSYDSGEFSINNEHHFWFDFISKEQAIYQISFGLPFLIGEAIYIGPELSGGMIFTPDADNLFLGGAIEYSWYPGTLFLLEGGIAFNTYLYVNVLYEFTFNNEFSYSIGKDLRLVLTFPGSYLFDDIQSISLFKLNPAFFCDLSIFKNWLAKLTVRGEIQYSNSIFFGNFGVSLEGNYLIK